MTGGWASTTVPVLPMRMGMILVQGKRRRGGERAPHAYGDDPYR